VSDQALGAYLNDHLAGSVGAVEMVERAIVENADNRLGRRLAEILEEIKKDQAVLQDLIERLGAKEDRLKKAGAWLAEKAGRVKLGGTGESSELARLEVLEILGIGMQGRLALWRALRVVQERYPAIQNLDLDLLEKRAVGQHDRVEEWRLEAAKEVL
jgi:phage terminase Nu1 subunit (DNA packaging protein)